MRGKSIAMLVLAMGCGLVAALGITQVVAKRNAAKPEPAGEAQDIFVVLENVPFGEPLTPELLGLEKWPKDKVPKGAITKLEDVKDRRTRTRLYQGEPVLESKIFGKGETGGGVSSMIEKGFRVVSVKVDSVSSSGDLIRPGDRVDVLVHVRDGGVSHNGQPSTQTILQHVKVFAVNDIVGPDSNKPISSKTISLLVTPDDAEKIMLASQLGQIQLVMRSPNDKEIVKTDGADVDELFDHGDDSQVALVPQPAEPSVVQEPEKTPKVQEPKKTPIALDPDAHKMRMMRGPVINVFVIQPEDFPPKPATEGGFWKITEVPGYAVTSDNQD